MSVDYRAAAAAIGRARLKAEFRDFLHGAAQAFDLFGFLGPSMADIRNPGETGAQADARALAGDLRRVGDDLREALRRESEGG